MSAISRIVSISAGSWNRLEPPTSACGSAASLTAELLAGHPSAGIGPVGNSAVADGQDAHKATPLVELVNHPVRPDAKRPELAEAAP